MEHTLCKDRKRWAVGLLALLLTLAVCLGGGLRSEACFVSPVVWLLRQNIGGEQSLVNVENYDQLREGVEIRKNLTYPSTKGRNRYDLYRPKGAAEPLPVVVWVHGGAFVAGTKDGIENYAVMLASQGYAVVGVDYEWAPEQSYPGQVRQVEECIQELTRVQADCGLDMSRVLLFGDSAGAHIAAQAALLATNPSYAHTLGVSSALTKEQLRGVVLYCGPYNVSQMLFTGNDTIDYFTQQIGDALMGDRNWREGMAIRTTTIKEYITPDFPPVFITDGNSGSFESQGRELALALEQLGVRTETLFFDPAQDGQVLHEYQFNIGDNGPGARCYQRTTEFLRSLR